MVLAKKQTALELENAVQRWWQASVEYCARPDLRGAFEQFTDKLLGPLFRQTAVEDYVLTASVQLIALDLNG